MARSTKEITVLLSYPKDEVGNDILYKEDIEKYNVNPYKDIITYEDYMDKYHNFIHPFTGVNMVDVYKELIEKEGCKANIVLSNNPTDILKYTNDVIICDIHTRFETKKKLEKQNANILMMSDILNKSINGSGYNKELTGKTIEVMIYGDGAFKDPVGKIWELADPVVSPAYTSGLDGSPNELKLKYLSENKFKDLSGEELNEKIREEIRNKNKDLKGQMSSQGTTPRRYTDLIGSLCDLTSGSGDKGTPVVFIQDYFTNYSD